MSVSREYLELCEDIYHIDPKYMVWLLYHKPFKENEFTGSPFCDHLGGCFIWMSTPQGTNYWSDLDAKVQQVRRNRRENESPNEI